MNPALAILGLIICIVTWFLMYEYFRPLGEEIGDVIDNAVKEMKEEDNEDA